MTKSRILFLSVICTLMVVTSCQKDEVSIDETEVLVEYLEGTSNHLGKDYVNTDMPSLISASELYTLNVAQQAYVIDIRSAADFNTGHIPGAHNVAVSDIFTHLETANLAGVSKIAIACYSGQSAAWATMLLRLSGIDNVFSLKWGMSSWHVDFATPWQSKTSNANATQFVSTATAKAEPGDLPEINTGFETGEEILAARTAAVLAEGFSPATITGATVFANPSNYYIVNYWPEAQYTTPGHIPGAVQYTPKQSIKLAADLKTLPTDKPVVIYCYSGQTSANLAAYLRLLGYDARTLLFGTNGMIYDLMVSNGMGVFTNDEIKGYTYDTNTGK